MRGDEPQPGPNPGSLLGKLAALEFNVACFGHGRVLKGEANLRFRRLVEKLAR